MKSIYLILFILVSQVTLAQERDFITKWSSRGPSFIFQVNCKGPVNYTWRELSPGNSSGTGQVVPTGFLTVAIGDGRLPYGAIVEVSISPTNLTGFQASSGAYDLIDVLQWGTAEWTTMESMFRNAINLNITATDIPNLSKVGTMFNMFNNCEKLTGPSNIGSWDVSNVTNMGAMFSSAYKFNQDISKWNTSKVTTMVAMFQRDSTFNQDISKWDTGNVTDMMLLFHAAISFNQDISGWNTSKVETMSSMFSGAKSFNQDISSWNTSNITNMTAMFYAATSFNQDLSTWDTKNVTNMSIMFYEASSFDQPLGSWELNSNVDLSNIFIRSGLSCSSYSTTLQGWGNNPSTPSGRNLGYVGLTYSPSVITARASLLKNGWTITNDIQSEIECLPILPMTLLYFTGQLSDDSNHLLSWSTTAEKENALFEIERSWEGQEFEKIGEIQGKGTNSVGNYEFSDRASGLKTHYRLKMIEQNGRYTYSDTVIIEGTLTTSAIGNFYPNPSSGFIYFDIKALESGSWNMTMLDSQGQLMMVQTYVLSIGKHTIRIELVNKGVHFIRIENGTISQVQKIISL